MTDSKLSTLIAEAVALDRDIATKTERLKELKEQLVAEANGREEEHAETEAGGRSWTAQGRDGCVVRVSYPVPTLKASIKAEGKPIAKIRALAGKFFGELFQQAPSYKPVEDFRDKVEKHLAPATARKLIEACTTESAPRVSFETKETVEAA